MINIFKSYSEYQNKREKARREKYVISYEEYFEFQSLS
jgi:hypothetical protein